MNTAIQSDHIWDMLKRRSTAQLTVRRFHRIAKLRAAVLPARRDQR